MPTIDVGSERGGGARRAGMSKTIFWSWQSDLDQRVTRNVIQDALKQAIAMLSADLEEADRPGLTSDTQGVAGTPDIVATILRKIDEAAVFVGDVTPIAVSSGNKACANPNVLIEMGYASRALTENRVIQVWNTAFEGATLDKLPFDMRGRRGPMSFYLPPGSDKAALRLARDELAKRLAPALRLAIDQVLPAPPEAVHWHPHHLDDPDVWFDRSENQLVTGPHGTTKLRWLQHFPGYARLIPSRWAVKSGARIRLSSPEGHPALLANANSLNFGASQGGAMTYWPRGKEFGAYPSLAITQWFERTGEFWGVGGGFLFETGQRVALSTGYIFKQWREFLTRNASLALENGGSLPIHIRLGVNALAETWWPHGPFDHDGDGRQAVEPSFEFQATLVSIAPDDLDAVVVAAFNNLAAVYGQEPFSLDEILGMAKR